MRKFCKFRSDCVMIGKRGGICGKCRPEQMKIVQEARQKWIAANYDKHLESIAKALASRRRTMELKRAGLIEGKAKRKSRALPPWDRIRTPMSFYLTKRQHAALKEYSTNLNKSVSEIIRTAILAEIDYSE